MPVGDWQSFEDCQREDKPSAREQSLLRLFEVKWGGGREVEMEAWAHRRLLKLENSTHGNTSYYTTRSCAPTWKRISSVCGHQGRHHDSGTCLHASGPANQENVMGGCSPSKSTSGRWGNLKGSFSPKAIKNKSPPQKKLNENSLEMQSEQLSKLSQRLSEVSHWGSYLMWGGKKKEKNERKQTVKCSGPKMHSF